MGQAEGLESRGWPAGPFRERPILLASRAEPGLPGAWLSRPRPTKTSGASAGFFGPTAPPLGCFYPGGVSSLACPPGKALSF